MKNGSDFENYSNFENGFKIKNGSITNICKFFAQNKSYVVFNAQVVCYQALYYTGTLHARKKKVETC